MLARARVGLSLSPMDPSARPGTAPLVLGPRGIKVLSIELVVVEGPSRGQRVALGGDVARVGSAPFNHLVLADPTVSRAHCELRVLSQSVSIKDCGSTNGTFVEGVNLREGELPPGATVRVGNSAFRLEPAGEPLVLAMSSRSSFGELIGESVAMRRVYSVLERVAATDSTVLIEGDTGTGKELAARALHAASARSAGPFVPVDCNAIPESLIESELFGHVRGAFPGADSARRGVFEEAHGGTLFLDEVADMPLAVQAKILRAIESKSVRRLGESQETPVDVRIVAASNRSLAACTNARTFREDLYYRLAVVELKLPPLRARREDIPLLAAHFYGLLAGPGARLPAAFVARLSSRSFPGNVRELRNTVERSVSLGLLDPEPGQSVESTASAPNVGSEPVVPLHLPLKEARAAWTESFESVYVRSMLQRTGGNLTRAAELSGVNRRFMQRLVARLGLRAVDDGGDGGES